MGTYGIAVAPSSGLITSESGRTAQFAIMLQGQPSADVTIGLSSSNPTEGLVSPASVTFTSSNWSTPVVATVTGQDDLVVDGDQIYNIVTAPATSSDPNYNGKDGVDVSVTNLDNDTNGVSMGGGALTTYEDQGQPPAQFQVVLTQVPTAPVTMVLICSDTSEGLVSLDNVTYGSSVSFVFNSGNYATARTVYVKGVDDTIKDGNVSYSILTSFNTSDPYYNSTNPPDVQVTNMDND